MQMLEWPYSPQHLTKSLGKSENPPALCGHPSETPTKAFMLGGAVASTKDGAKKMPKIVKVTRPSPMISNKSSGIQWFSNLDSSEKKHLPKCLVYMMYMYIYI